VAHHSLAITQGHFAAGANLTTAGKPVRAPAVTITDDVMSTGAMSVVESVRAQRSAVLHPGTVAVVAALIAIVVFSGALSALVSRWIADEEFSHGFLIPVVAVWLLWTRRHSLLASIGRPSWLGVVFVLLAGAMHVIAGLSLALSLAQIGFILALVGLVLGLGGYSLLKEACVPLLFLLFAIPVPILFNDSFSIQLQLISSELGAFFIRMLQIPVFLDGNVIDLGYYKIQVVDACSGLRYIYPLLSLSFLLAYMF
jgi:exosortase